MFRSKLIENTAYYKIKMYFFLTGIISAFLIQFSEWYIGWSILGIIIFLFGSILAALIQKGYGDQMKLFFGNKRIEISESAIKILNNKKEVLQLYDISKVKKITILDQYKIPDDKLLDLIKLNPRNNFLILQMEEEEIRLDFEIDSYYGIKQLEKVIDSWNKNGINLQQTNQQLLTEK